MTWKRPGICLWVAGICLGVCAAATFSWYYERRIGIEPYRLSETMLVRHQARQLFLAVCYYYETHPQVPIQVFSTKDRPAFIAYGKAISPDTRSFAVWAAALRTSAHYEMPAEVRGKLLSELLDAQPLVVASKVGGRRVVFIVQKGGEGKDVADAH